MNPIRDMSEALREIDRLRKVISECVDQLDSAGYDIDFEASNVKHKLLESIESPIGGPDK